MRPMETHETQRDQLRLMRLMETNGDSWDSERPKETHEAQRDYWRRMRPMETQRDYWRLMRWRLMRVRDYWRRMRPMETQRDYWRLMRPMGTHETHETQWGLMRIRETNGEQWGLRDETNGDETLNERSERWMGTHETERLLETHENNADDSWDSERLLENQRPMGTHETQRD